LVDLGGILEPIISKLINLIKFWKMSMIDEANQQLRFFIVDDDPSIVDLQKALLEEAGHQAQSTTDSTAAMERIRDYAPDCVLLDLMMPNIGGLQLIGDIKKRGCPR
jgi:CheY-like chemotaxis protein